MKKLRQYIRQIILESPELQSDIEELVHNRDEYPAYSSSRSMATQHREYAKTKGRDELPFRNSKMSDDDIDRSFDLRRDVKKFWNENADHSFWQNPNKVIAVHDLGYYADLNHPDEADPTPYQAEDEDDILEKDLTVPLFIKKYPPGKIQRDEMSTYGFHGSMNSVFPLKTIKLGIILDPRRVTYASKRDAFSESRGQASAADKDRHKGSGLPKRPRVGRTFTGRNALFDEEDVKNSGFPGGRIGELIVDNWSYKTVVLEPSVFGDKQTQKKLIASIKAHGIEVYHVRTGQKL